MGLGPINLNLQSKTEKLAGYNVGCQKKMRRSNQTRPGRGIPVISPENSYTVNLAYRGYQSHPRLAVNRTQNNTPCTDFGSSLPTGGSWSSKKTESPETGRIGVFTN